MVARIATRDGDRSTTGADLAGAPGGSGWRGLVLSRQTAMAASPDHFLSALADRCRAMGFVFAAAGRGRDSVNFLAQRPVRRRWIARLLLCFRLFRCGLAPDPGTNR